MSAMIGRRALGKASAAHHVDHENQTNHSSDNSLSLRAGKVYRIRRNASIFWEKFPARCTLDQICSHFL